MGPCAGAVSAFGTWWVRQGGHALSWRVGICGCKHLDETSFRADEVPIAAAARGDWARAVAPGFGLDVGPRVRAEFQCERDGRDRASGGCDMGCGLTRRYRQPGSEQAGAQYRGVGSEFTDGICQTGQR